jgi:hypothetical protein
MNRTCPLHPNHGCDTCELMHEVRYQENSTTHRRNRQCVFLSIADALWHIALPDKDWGI